MVVQIIYTVRFGFFLSVFIFLLILNNFSHQDIQEKLGTMNNGEVYAVFSYDAINPDELSFSINEKLTILRKGDEAEREWWWARNASNQEGYVPRNLLGVR